MYGLLQKRKLMGCITERMELPEQSKTTEMERKQIED